MQLHTLDGAVLIEIKSVQATKLKSGTESLLIEGKIMGTMPMKAVISPDELRAGLRLLNWRLVRTAVAMLFRRSK